MNARQVLLPTELHPHIQEQNSVFFSPNTICSSFCEAPIHLSEEPGIASPKPENLRVMGKELPGFPHLICCHNLIHLKMHFLFLCLSPLVLHISITSHLCLSIFQRLLFLRSTCHFLELFTRVTSLLNSKCLRVLAGPCPCVKNSLSLTPRRDNYSDHFLPQEKSGFRI